MGPMRDTADVGAGRFADLAFPHRYAPVRFLASGGMGSVWCAEDRVLGRRVAIKVLSPSFARDQAAVRRFKRESRAAGRLSGHPNIVTTYDIGETAPSDGTPGRAFIVMEYLAGGTLAEALRADAVTPQDTIRWLAQAAAALDYAHGQGVLHRDIKLANLLLDHDRVVHVADFGIARLASEDTLTGADQVLGTAAYLAPERALGHGATAASDRYSLAVAAFELLVGRRPFIADNFTAVARQHVDDEPPPASRLNPALPPALDAVLSRGMAKRPEDRWPTALAFANAVEAALGETAPARPRVARVSPPPWHDTRQVKPRGRIAAIGALAAAALGVGLALGANHHSAPKPPNGPRLSARAPARKPAPATVHAQLPAQPRPRPKPRPKPKPISQPSPPANPVQAAPAAATTPPPTADTLEARGHALMLAGTYAAAIPILRQALQDASPGSDTYAYALYDLGRSLRLEGDVRAAVPVLAQRLKIPIATGIVRSELQSALRTLGQQQRSGGAAPAPPPKHGHDGRDGDTRD